MLKRLENFWYHYKWAAIITAFFSIVFIIFAVQIFTRESYDVYMIYAGPVNIFSDDHNDMDKAVNKFASDEQEISINIQNIVYVPEKSAEEYKKNDIYFSPAENQRAFNDFSKNLVNGKNTILFLTPELYNFAIERGAVLPLSEIFENIPSFALDSFGLKLSETRFYKENGVCNLPDDTIVCFRNSKSSANAIKSKKNSEAYENQIKIFRKLFDEQ